MPAVWAELTDATEQLALAHVVAGGVAQALQALAQAVSACSGVAVDEVGLDEAAARCRVAAGATVLLLRQDAKTSDIAAFAIVAALLTWRGARTAHAAVMARQPGEGCTMGCESLRIDARSGAVN